MNSVRFYKDMELQNPAGTVFIPQRTPYTIIQSALLLNQRATEIKAYNRDEEAYTATVAHSIARVEGVNVSSEEVWSRDTNIFPLDSYERITVTGASRDEQARNLAVIENENPRYAFTEGRTRFQIFYGESTDYIFIGLSAAFMYTNGPIPPAGLDGFQSVPFYDYYPFIGYNTAGSIFSISKSVYRDDEGNKPRISFASNAFRFADEDEGRQIIVAAILAKQIDRDNWVLLNATGSSSNVRAYTSDVFEGISFYVPEYVPTDSNINHGGSGNGLYPYNAPEGANWEGMVTARNQAFASSMGSGRGLTWYKMGQTSFVQSLSYLYGAGWNMLFSEKRVSAYIAAYQLPIMVSGEHLNRFWLADDSFNLTCDVLTTALISKTFNTLDMRNYGWDDWNDFTNTRATLFLPFVGRINIDVNAFIRGTIRLNALIDVRNGNISYWVYTNSMQGIGEILYGTYTGNCAVTVPVSGIYRGNVLGHVLNVGSAIASGDFIRSAKSALDIAEDVHVNKGGAIDTSSSSISPYEPRLDIERKEMLRVEQYQEVEGIPSFVTKKFNELNGFIKVQSATYEMLSCEQDEKEQIRELLESGVYV